VTRRRDELTSGFVRLDFLLTFTVGADAARARLVSLCEEEWSGTRVGGATWEISSALSPAAFEEALAPHLGVGDTAVFYYLSDSKRLFRVVVLG
jgi:hypothetical protein